MKQKELIGVPKQNDDAIVFNLKLLARNKAIEIAPTYRISHTDSKQQIPLTAKEKVDEAEIIYQWLIKEIS